MKPIIYDIILFASLASLLMVTLYYANAYYSLYDKADNACAYITSGKIQEVIETKYVESTPEYIEIARLMADGYEYDKIDYNCWDFSTRLNRELRNAGYASRIAYGLTNCSCDDWWDADICGENNAHVWIEVDLGKVYIESTRGVIIPSEIYGRCYKFGYYGVGR